MPSLAWLTICVLPATQSLTFTTPCTQFQQEYSDGVSLATAQLPLAFDVTYSDTIITALRFQINLPAGAVINETYVQFSSSSTTPSSGATTLRIWAEGNVDPSELSISALYNVSSRVRTNSFVEWSPAAWGSTSQTGADERTPNIAAVLQELVAQLDWPNNTDTTVVLIFQRAPSDLLDNFRIAQGAAGSATFAPKLTVKYSQIGTFLFVPITSWSSEPVTTHIPTLNGNILNLPNNVVFGDEVVGLYFEAVFLPPTASVVWAYIQFTCNQPSATNDSLVVTVEASTLPPAFTTTTHDISSRTRAGVNVTWTPSPWVAFGDSGIAQQTVDVSALVQELVDADTWTDGGASIVAIVQRTGEGTSGDRAASSPKINSAPLDLVVLYLSEIDNSSPSPSPSPSASLLNSTVATPSSGSSFSISTLDIIIGVGVVGAALIIIVFMILWCRDTKKIKNQKSAKTVKPTKSKEIEFSVSGATTKQSDTQPHERDDMPHLGVYGELTLDEMGPSSFKKKRMSVSNSRNRTSVDLSGVGVRNAQADSDSSEEATSSPATKAAAAPAPAAAHTPAAAEGAAAPKLPPSVKRPTVPVVAPAVVKKAVERKAVERKAVERKAVERKAVEPTYSDDDDPTSTVRGEEPETNPTAVDSDIEEPFTYNDLANAPDDVFGAVDEEDFGIELTPAAVPSAPAMPAGTERKTWNFFNNLADDDDEEDEDEDEDEDEEKGVKEKVKEEVYF